MILVNLLYFFVHNPMSIINVTVLMLVKVSHNSSKNGPLIFTLLIVYL